MTLTSLSPATETLLITLRAPPPSAAAMPPDAEAELPERSTAPPPLTISADPIMAAAAPPPATASEPSSEILSAVGAPATSSFLMEALSGETT